MGPLIEKAAVERFDRHRAGEGRRRRSHHAAGRSRGQGNFVGPTIVIAENDWPIVQTETFAPVMYLIPFDSLDEAIEMQNDIGARTLVSHLHRPPATRRSVPVRLGQRLRHRQRQHRHVGRGDRRRVRRREGHGRRPRVGLGFLEGVHAPADQHDQLEPRAAARAGHHVRDQGRPVTGKGAGASSRARPSRQRELETRAAEPRAVDAIVPPYSATVSCTIASPRPWPGVASSARPPRSSTLRAIALRDARPVVLDDERERGA